MEVIGDQQRQHHYPSSSVTPITPCAEDPRAASQPLILLGSVVLIEAVFPRQEVPSVPEFPGSFLTAVITVEGKSDQFTRLFSEAADGWMSVVPKEIHDLDAVHSRFPHILHHLSPPLRRNWRVGTGAKSQPR